MSSPFPLRPPAADTGPRGLEDARRRGHAWKKPFIMVAPTGARRSKADHPALPLTLPEIVATASECFAAGADGLHLHIRDAQGRHSLDPGLYAETLTELGSAVPEMLVQVTTESAGLFDVQHQLACLERLRPARASISLREIARAPELAAKVYDTCADAGTELQHILYDTEDIALLQKWRACGIVKDERPSVILVLGRYTAGQRSDPADLAGFVAALPPEAHWMLCAFGAQEHECLAEAARAGGKLRVGFENSLTRSDGQPHANNAASVASLIERLERTRT